MYHGEKFNAWTHLAGGVLALIGTVWLLILAAMDGDVAKIVSVAIYGFTLVLLYSTSTVYHSVRGRAKAVMQKLDHLSIYLLIAGSYTPFCLVTLRGAWGWWLFGIIWALAAAGIVFKLFFTGRFKVVSTLIYVAMGWLVVVATGPLRAELPGSTLAWLVAGGLAYTAGTLFYLARFRFAHAVWHGFVLAGSVCHFAAVLVEVLRVGI